jgi:hypothetical protein
MITAILFALVPATAVADEPALHELTTLDRATGQTGVGADLSYTTGDLGDLEGGASRIDLHGQYMLRSGVGVYGAFAVSKAFLDAKDPANQMFADAINDATALSNLELGLQMRRQLRGDLALVGHAGITLPTAQDDDFGAVLTNLMSAPRRFTDLVTAIPDTTALRLGISPIWSRGALFARADLGVDVIVDEPEMSSSDPIVHANLAVGGRSGKLSGALELVTLGTTGTIDEDQDRFLHTAAISLRYDAGRFAPNLTVVTPLDDSGRGELITVGAGVAATF